MSEGTIERGGHPISRVLVTGATGLVGYSIVAALLREGSEVVALVRSGKKAASLLPAACQLMEGDVTDARAVRLAMRDCAEVYHAAGVPEQWLADPGIFDRINAGGTRTLVEAAVDECVRKFIYISTIDVFQQRSDGSFDESRIDPLPRGTPYGVSKQRADQLVMDAVQKGLPGIFIHPAAVYGPGPTASFTLNRFIQDIYFGKVPLLPPGGVPVVFAPDVAQGCMLAAAKGGIAERYTLSDSYLTFQEMAREILHQLGRSRIPPVMPFWLADTLASMAERISRLTHKPPLIHRGQLHVSQLKAQPINRKAIADLGWSPTPFRIGVGKTLDVLRSGHSLMSHAS